MYLLDTAVVLDLRQAKAGLADPALAAWAGSIPRQALFLSAVSVMELDSGAIRLERKDKVAGQVLRSWIDQQVLNAFDGRILPVDLAVARRRGQWPQMAMRDGLLAATAASHGLTLATREIGTFKPARIKLFDPWSYKPAPEEEDNDWRQAARAAPLWLKNLFVRS